MSNIISEDDQVFYGNDSELSYYDKSEAFVELYVNNEYVGDCEVWIDRDNDFREYLTLNNTVVYLDTITKM